MIQSLLVAMAPARLRYSLVLQRPFLVKADLQAAAFSRNLGHAVWLRLLIESFADRRANRRMGHAQAT